MDDLITQIKLKEPHLSSGGRFFLAEQSLIKVIKLEKEETPIILNHYLIFLIWININRMIYDQDIIVIKKN
jgi:hypothetical protein